MKIQVKYGLAIVAMLSLITCDQSAEKIIYTGPSFVFFDSKEQISLYENQKTALQIPLKVSSAQADNTQVTFEVIGDNVLANSDYKVQTASPVEIVRSKFETSISILPVDNAVVQPESRTITVRITSVSNPNLSIQVVKEVQINLLDDDCAPTVPKVALWVGSLNISSNFGSSTGTGEGGVGGICGGSLVVTGKLVGDSNPSSTMTIQMTQTPASPSKGVASVIRFPLFGAGSQYEYDASGTYDEVAKVISLNFSIHDTTDATFLLTGTHTITPK
jgi:hypothetical protein